MTLTLRLDNTDAKLTVQERGAHVRSWTTRDGSEQLFLSRKAIDKKGTALRGGVPIIFPQFGALGDGKKHGFAREVNWTLQETLRDESCAIFCLESNADTLRHWPFRFAAEFIVALNADTLTMTLKITNADSTRFQFAAALHSYFRVDDIDDVVIKGLKNCAYWDNGNDFAQRSNSDSDALTVDGPIDRVYFSTKKPVVLQEPKSQRAISAQGFTDTVVWNPGAEGAEKLADFDNDEYREMICIESAAIEPTIKLNPGQVWSGRQKLFYSLVNRGHYYAEKSGLGHACSNCFSGCWRRDIPNDPRPQQIQT